VVVDFVGGLIRAVNLEYGTHLTKEDINGWDLHPVLDPIIGRSFWAWLRDREWLWANFDVIPGAIGAIDTLRRQGHYVEMVTSKPEWAEHNVWKWLGKWRPAFNRVTIVGIDKNKSEATDADLLIDDKPMNCLDFINSGRQSLLFAQPHNLSLRHGHTVVENWSDALSIIKVKAAM